MKKTNLFKRAIAVFISILMVVSSLPFTAITASAAVGVAGSTLENLTLSKFDPNPVINTDVANTNNNYTNLKGTNYNSVLYMQKFTSSDYHDITTDKCTGSIYHSKNTVMMDDGTSDMLIPIMIREPSEYTWTGSNTWCFTSLYPCTAQNNNADSSEFGLKDYWYGGFGVGNLDWYYALTYNNRANKKIGYNSSVKSDGENVGNKGVFSKARTPYYANSLVIKRPVSYGSSNYKKYTNIYWYLYARSNNNEKTGSITDSDSAIYVVNYAPMATQLAIIQAEYNGYKNSGKTYTADSLSAYQAAVKAIADFNLGSYDFSQNTEDKVAQASDAIATIMNNYNSTAKPVEFHEHTMSEWAVKTPGTCTTKTVEERHCTAADCTDSNKASETRETTLVADNHTALAANWTKTSGGTNHYKQCSNCKNYVYEECDYQEVANSAVSATCTTAGKEADKQCTGCKDTKAGATVTKLEHSYTGASEHTNANGDTNGYTEYRCVNGCNKLGGRVYDTVDWSAYDAAVVEANANIDNTVKYTADSIREYSDEVAKYTTDVTSGDETKSQAFIDRMTDGITEAKPILKLNQYEVTFNVQYNTTTIHTGKDTVAYGTVKQFNYTPDDGKYIDKWTAENSDSEITSTIATASEIASHTIYSDTIVTVYICDTEKVSADTCSVTLLDKNDKVIGYANVAKDSVITKNGNTLELGNDVVLVAPKYPYYQIMDFVNVDTNATVVSTAVTENIVIKAQYSVSPTITITSSQAVTINGNDTTSYNAKWDERITVTAPNATAWYAGEKLLAYGSTYTFQASADVELSYTTEEVSKTDASSRIDYTGYDSDLKAFRVVVSNCVPDNATIVKQGVKILTSSKTGVTVASSKVIAGTKDYVATKTTGTGKQFMYTIGVADSINTMAVVSYVAYTVPGDSEVHYAYSSTGDATATMISK